MAAILLAWAGEEFSDFFFFLANDTLTLLFLCQDKATQSLCCVLSSQEKESVFLLDDKRISEINMVSGRTKKKTPKLHPLLSSAVTMASSHNGEFDSSEH